MSQHAFWRGKRVLITGGSSGIGRAFAANVARAGASVALIARDAERLAAVGASLPDKTAWCSAVADVVDRERLQLAVKECEAEIGPTDVVLASAGIHRYTPASDFDTRDLTAVINTNLVGVINTFGTVVPSMLQRGRGHLAAVASIAGLIGLPEVGAYSASKSALITLLQSFRADLHPHGLRVTAICPGFVDTPFVAGHDPRALKNMITPDRCAAVMTRAIASGRARVFFPWQTALLARTAACMPDAVYRWLLRLVPKGPAARRDAASQRPQSASNAQAAPIEPQR